ncbi:phage tail tape measure protein [Pseudomonas aeruginosa]|uniref:phage tail tape measure protein n=1 Tax=Pseudomonas aeruginosa TaxID=287 RepID=UPI00352418C1|nr:phage tail tape measure protein [Pseudomonas aeruginosa]
MSDQEVQGMLIQIEATTAQLRRELKRGDDAVGKATKNIDAKLGKVDGAFGRMNVSADKAVGGVVSSLRGLVAPIAAAVSALGAISKGVDIQREFDRLNSGLITATGSSEKAAVAFEALREFAQKTPYDLGQAVDGFTKLVNLGLTPSERALTSYGNTASSMGKDLNQMIEAVADAATGEFERLKEFGIKASKDGDRVSLTFQGVTTSIGNNAAEIEKYLIGLGENQFAGAMEIRMKTLDGAIANLGDTWDQTFRLINDAGAGELMRGAVVATVEALDELNAMLESGQLEGYLDAIGGKFDGWGEDIEVTINTLAEQFGSLFAQMGTDAQSQLDVLTEGFKNFPENVRAFVQLMTVEVLAGFEKAAAYAVSFKDKVKAVFTDDTFDDVGARLSAELVRINGVRDSSIDSIISERDAAIGSYQAQTAASDERRKQYEAEREEQRKNTADRLAQFKRESEGQGKSTATAKKHTDELKKQLAAIDAIIAKALPEKKRLEDLAKDIEGVRKAHSLGLLSAEQMEEGIKNLNETYADGSIQKRIQQEQKLAEQRRNSADAYRKAMEVVLQARQDAINSDVAGIGLGDDERDQAQRLDAVRKKYADLRRELEAQQEDASRRLGPAAYEQRLADLADFQARELQMEVDGYGARLDAQRDYRNGARRAWQNIQADANDVASAMDDGLTAGFYSARDALADFATTGKLNFHDFASSVINDMARIAAQQAATSALSGLLGIGASALGGWFGGSATAGASASGYTGSAYSNWAAMQADGGAWANGVQMFATGGAFTNSVVNTPTAFGMSGGRMGVMGEAGPEAILPLARNSDGSLGVRMAGGMPAGGNTYNFPLSVDVEVSGVSTSSPVPDVDPTLLGKTVQAVAKTEVTNAITNGLRPGGSIWRAINGRG